MNPSSARCRLPFARLLCHLVRLSVQRNQYSWATTSLGRPRTITPNNHRAPSAKSYQAFSRDDDSLPAEPAAGEECSVPKVHLVMWELRVNSGFGGIVLSPVGQQCVSKEDHDLMKRRGLTVVDCSWARSADVPFVKLRCAAPRLWEAVEDDDSDDGLPPLERNMNRLSLEESEEDSE